jgi:hypothetical protein
VKTTKWQQNDEAEKFEGKSLKTQREAVVCASITFPPGVYETLEEIVQQKKVSFVWVVRDAAEKYTAEQKTAVRKHNQW